MPIKSMEPSMPPPYGEGPVRFTNQTGKRFEFVEVETRKDTSKPNLYALDFTLSDDKGNYSSLSMNFTSPLAKSWLNEKGTINKGILQILFNALQEASFYEKILNNAEDETIPLQPDASNILGILCSMDGSISLEHSEHYKKDRDERISYEICKLLSADYTLGVSSSDLKDKIWFPEEVITEVLESGGGTRFPYWAYMRGTGRYRIEKEGEVFLQEYPTESTIDETIGFKPPEK